MDTLLEKLAGFGSLAVGAAQKFGMKPTMLTGATNFSKTLESNTRKSRSAMAAKNPLVKTSSSLLEKLAKKGKKPSLKKGALTGALIGGGLGGLGGLIAARGNPLGLGAAIVPGLVGGAIGTGIQAIRRAD